MDYSTTIALMKNDQKAQNEYVDTTSPKVINLTLSPVCAILISSDPIHHSNSKLVYQKLGLDLKVDVNVGMIEILQTAYPQWFQVGHTPVSDPLSGSVEYMMIETRHVNKSISSGSSSEACRRARIAG